MNAAVSKVSARVLSAFNELVGNMLFIFHSSGAIHRLVDIARMLAAHHVGVPFRRVPVSRVD